MKHIALKAFFTTILLLTPVLALGEATEIEELQVELKALKAKVEGLEQRLAEAEAREGESVQLVPEEMATVTAEPVIPDSVVHLAGYGAATYSDVDGMEDGFGDVLFAPIFHYQYKDKVLFEAELEIEVDDDGQTETALEYVTVDMLLGNSTALVAGKFLSPLGQFTQNLHPTWINKLPTAPPGFGHGEAAPLSDLGAQLRGGFKAGGGLFNYAVYAANGPRLELEHEEGGEDGDDHEDAQFYLLSEDDDHEEPGEHEEEEFEIHGIESEGFVGNDDGELVFGGRIGYLPVPNFEIGLSAAFGEVGLYGPEGFMAQEPTHDYEALGADLYWRIHDMVFRAEYIQQEVDAEEHSVVPGKVETDAWYAQASYRPPGSPWEGVLRYADYSALERHNDQEQFAFGINYLFTETFLVKLSYQDNDGEAGSLADADRWIMQVAYGF